MTTQEHIYQENWRTEEEQKEWDEWCREKQIERVELAEELLNHKCPCEKVIKGVKSAGEWSLLIGAIVVGGTIAATKYAIKEITKEVRK